MRKIYIGQTIIDSDKLRRDKSWKRFSDNVRRTVNSGPISIASSSLFMPQATLESTRWYTMQAQSLLAVLWLTDLVAFLDDKSPLQLSLIHI